MLPAAEFCSAQWHGVWVYNWPHTCIRDWHSHSWLWHATAFYAQVLLTVVSMCFFASWIPCSSFCHTSLLLFLATLFFVQCSMRLIAMVHSNSLVHKVREIMYVASRIWLWRTKHSEWKDVACFILLLWSIWYLHLFMFLGESCELPLAANDVLSLAWFTLYISVLMAKDELWSSSMTGWGCWCSIREMCGTEDVDIAYNHFKAFYQIFTTIDKQLSVDAWWRCWVCFRIIWLIYFCIQNIYSLTVH